MQGDISIWLTIVGLVIIFSIVGLLISNKVSPIVGMIIIPIIGALIAGFGFQEIAVFLEKGSAQVMGVVIMFIFAILYFGIMQDIGLFNPFIRFMIVITRGNVVIVAIATALIGMIAQLDGAGASTFLLCIPALLPLYKELHMSRYLLLLLVALSAGVINMIPWGGPTARAATVIEADLIEYYLPLIPVQAIGAGLIILLAVLLGFREKRRIAKRAAAGEIQLSNNVNIHAIADQFMLRQNEERAQAKEQPRSYKGLSWMNLILTIAVLSTMMSGLLAPQYAFMIGVAIALPLNYKGVDSQMERVKAHAPNALMMAAVILAAGVFLGVLNESDMLKQIALAAIAIMPGFVVPYVHIIVGIFGVPMDLLTSTDAYYFALLPIVEQIATTQGVAATSTAYAMMIGNIIGTFVSPFSPALWLGIGLASANMGKHIKYSFFWLWGFSIVLLGFAILIGVI
ncbi:CitMHS family transporter [Gracilibacillus alcaliphilus]|uniref:CitMHS family transporter n=1 Tax=Gracilibacillus alcaliphilus TaxID=1401441 RepID=UPI00195E81B0|nr:citrate:proton symporter [Gracilibacillus alcaliphilus]MBM7677256.1 CitMHS family citrate-Mg2+:H+ or citrate-Ca2+:H+ symporter [Gracilibacillus alcaliphilus]